MDKGIWDLHSDLFVEYTEMPDLVEFLRYVEEEYPDFPALI